MARPRRVTAALAAAAALLAFTAPYGAGAQGLRRLHVDALSMRADSAHLQVHQVFHLAIHAHVREKVLALDELVVPNVGTMQLEGDERRVTQAPSGTDVVETLTLEPVASGTYTFRGAYLDAIDARSGKPSRFSANPVTVVVEGSAPLQGQFFDSALRFMLGVTLAFGAVLAAVTVLIALAARRRRREGTVMKPFVMPAAVAPPPSPAPPRSARERVADALRAYRTAPANGSLIALRTALFEAAGSNAGATLRDALARSSDPALRAALSAAEHAAFGPAHARDASSAELIAAAEGWLR